MRYRSILVAVALMAPAVAWTVSKDFNARMWLAQVPSLPASANVAYQQWIDDGNGALKPGEAFTTVDQGINTVIADQNQADMPSANSQAQQMSSAQQMMAKYSTPEGQAALKTMSPAQLMALAQQMQPQSSMPHAVSPEDQVLLQKMNNGVYSGQQQVLEDSQKIQIQINALYAQWDQALAPLNAQEEAKIHQLPVCPGEASIPSDADLSAVKISFAKQRASISSQYLAQIEPLIGKVRVVVLSEIDFGDDALAAWSKISDPALKQQVSASAHGAEQIALGDVGRVEKLIEDASSKAAQFVQQQKALEKQYANANGCGK